ncbi:MULTISPECIES: TIGR03086 family metal-binding protein [Rhodococcus]|uniref:TIGR03086 family metal-binding protein n=1 Tax=Rhodococcus rhodochrous TaxID=1829 RepID=A0AAW4X921_RHORH|nr:MULTISPECIES: TIGR03086 family metal-binding protein [Rhodococcus]MCD2109603.1 TIGR03086 family metal-binding protein [Rhodococcus rhodochrous]QHG83836.1 TIGR03086 family protein [Rhodococcus rhodochrous]QOH56480.1 TIGR03086 family protein [Rhodococcus rhodochrous]
MTDTTETLDLTPATRRMERILTGIDDAQLSGPTPCSETSVGALVDHVLGLSLAFTAAARKDIGLYTDTPPQLTSELTPDWRRLVPDRLGDLRGAWSDREAWEGMTRAGGLDLPAPVAGLVTLDELVVHGWDLAVATGQQYSCEPDEIAACTAFAESITDEERVADGGGLFGPAVRVGDDAPPLERLIGLTGRDPSWRPPA